MKLIFYLLFLFASLSAFVQEQPPITVKVTNIKQAKGTMRVAFYKKGSGFPKEGSITFAKETKVSKAGELTLKFTDIPYGEYAIAVFQDKNQNQKIDKNLIGYPTEPFGFSKNFKPRFSAPEFKDCNVIISATNNLFSIKLLD